MNKKVLFISYDGMTDPLGQSQVLPYLRELSKIGYQITILSFEKKRLLLSEGDIIRKITTDAGIKWVPLTFTAKPPILSKMYDRWNMLRTAAKLHKKEKFDFLHCRSYISAEAGMILKKKTGSGFLFDMRGFWADEKVDSGQWDLKKLFFRKLYQSYKQKEKAYIRSADAIVSLTEAGKKYLNSIPDFKNIPIDVIPCCADLAHFDYTKVSADETAALKKSLGIADGKKVITYLGSIGGWYMTNEMFAFYKELVRQDPSFLMLILTKDAPERVLEEAAASGIANEQLIVRYAKRSEVPTYLSLTDASIFFIRPTFSKTASSPTKHAELMGMGIPVICNDIGDTGNIIDATGTGVVIREFSDEAYKKAVAALPVLSQLPKHKIREAAFAYFDLDKGAAHYAEIYQKIINRTHHP